MVEEALHISLGTLSDSPISNPRIPCRHTTLGSPLILLSGCGGNVTCACISTADYSLATNLSCFTGVGMGSTAGDVQEAKHFSYTLKLHISINAIYRGCSLTQLNIS